MSLCPYVPMSLCPYVPMSPPSTIIQLPEVQQLDLVGAGLNATGALALCLLLAQPESLAKGLNRWGDQLSFLYSMSRIVLRRAAFSSGSLLDRLPLEPPSSASGSLHAGQRLAKPGFSGLSSNSSPQTTQVRIGNGIAVLFYGRREPAVWVEQGVKPVVVSSNYAQLFGCEPFLPTSARSFPT